MIIEIRSARVDVRIFMTFRSSKLAQTDSAAHVMWTALIPGVASEGFGVLNLELTLQLITWILKI